MITTFKLREWNFDDIPSLVLYLNNKKIWDNLRDRVPFPYSEQDGREWIQSVINKKPPANFAIDVDSKAVGSIGIYVKDNVYRLNAELGYWLSEDFWNQGIMTEAVKQMVEYAFLNFEIVRIYSCVFEHNLPSMRVLKKAGFHKEAIHRKSVIKNGKIIDEHLFVMLKPPNPPKGTLGTTWSKQFHLC